MGWACKLIDTDVSIVPGCSDNGMADCLLGGWWTTWWKYSADLFHLSPTVFHLFHVVPSPAWMVPPVEFDLHRPFSGVFFYFSFGHEQFNFTERFAFGMLTMKTSKPLHGLFFFFFFFFNVYLRMNSSSSSILFVLSSYYLSLIIIQLNYLHSDQIIRIP